MVPFLCALKPALALERVPAAAAGGGLLASQQGQQTHREEADADDDHPDGVTALLGVGRALGARNEGHGGLQEVHRAVVGYRFRKKKL